MTSKKTKAAKPKTRKQKRVAQAWIELPGGCYIMGDDIPVSIQGARHVINGKHGRLPLTVVAARMLVSTWNTRKSVVDARTTRRQLRDAQKKSTGLLKAAREMLPEIADVVLTMGDGSVVVGEGCELVVDGNEVGWRVDKLHGRSLVAGIAEGDAVSIPVERLSHSQRGYSVAISRVQP